MSLLDYNSLVTLSVTLNLAYVLAGSLIKVRYRREATRGSDFLMGNGFYHILAIYFNSTCRKMSAMKLSLSRRAEKILSRARHCNSHDGLSLSQKKEIKRIRNDLRDCINESNRLYRKCVDDASGVTEIRFFPHVSLLFAMAGILLLFAATMDKSHHLYTGGVLIAYDIILMTMLVCFIAVEIILQKRLRRGADITDNLNNKAYISVISLVFILILFLLIFRVSNPCTPHVPFNSTYEMVRLYETTVLILFSNFIGYFLLVLMRLVICLLFFVTGTAGIVKRYKIKDNICYLDSLQDMLKPEDISGITLKIR